MPRWFDKKPKERPPQPEWLKAFSWNYAHGEQIQVWMDGKRFAILKSPGHNWSDNSGTHYGGVAYYLHDKTESKRARMGTLIHEGRLKKDDIERLQQMCEASNFHDDMVILTKGQTWQKLNLK